MCLLELAFCHSAGSATAGLYAAHYFDGRLKPGRFIAFTFPKMKIRLPES
jgi:hypothetical protein